MSIMTEFIQDRNEALLSLDREKIIEYCQKYGARFSSNEKVFWASVHKARIAIKSFPETEKEKSRKWLRENGFRTDF